MAFINTNDKYQKLYGLELELWIWSPESKTIANLQNKNIQFGEEFLNIYFWQELLQRRQKSFETNNDQVDHLISIGRWVFWMVGQDQEGQEGTD